ncbi:structural maintenance of chromosomes protein 6 [Aspergillus brasiliensis]|uniref:Structural maintenance of chromosomes protein 6 n=1 Tax=Aspergillus brasiliensis TaxID=319629 RepID=A0A9W6DT48_9EURO|nr:structural maintenance of chromosomes protein 6 [Aspergillus brasiliensis]GKZ51605.1 structural maintenance of chromosomes protein 6 [Aspergillus brasiliensis]
MPSMKRSQTSLEPSDSGDENTSSSSPSPKRPRRTNSPSEGSTADSENGVEGMRVRSLTQALDNDDEDELELQATQVIQEKYSFTTDEPNIPAEHGILERVECYNFMCHDHFYVDLGPLINFIVGKNGSGKSAVLTAITLCLGGKASTTNRGQSLKSFIKEGKE